MTPTKLIRSAVFLAVTSAAPWVSAQMAQDPLLNAAAGVPPNIVFLFDDSGSMPSTGLYQYGGTPGGLGMTGPGNDVGFNAPSKFHDRSPDVNQIYYDPRVYYARRVDPSGSPLAPGSTSGVTSFNVYFYNPGTSPVYKVSGVTITNPGGGYPATVGGSFTLAPTSGTTAQATVTTGPSTVANSVTVNSIGTNYPSAGVVATFSSPPAGGVTATGNVTVTQVNKISNTTVAATAFGSGYPASGVTATFSPPSTPNGVTATGNPVIVARGTVASVNITNPGTGFPASGKTITFSNPPAGGVTATGTLTTGAVYTLTTVTVNDGGAYTSAPAVVVAGPRVTGAAATTGTATLGARNRAASVTMTAGGNYTVAPTAVFSGARVGGSAATGDVQTATRYQVTSFAVNNPGTSNYTSNPTVTLTGGTGTAATTSVVRTTMNRVTNVSGSGGSGCGAAGTRTVTFSTSPFYGSVAATATANINASGQVTSISGFVPGYGYAGAPVATVAGCTTQPSLTVTSSTYSGISAINVTTGGAYTTAPTGVSFSGGGGAGAAASVSSSPFLTVTGVTMTSNGAGYTGTPTVAFTGGTGSGATGTVVPASYQAVTSVSLAGGLVGYTGVPTISFTGGTGSGASATINNTSSTGIVGVTITDPGSGYTTAPTITGLGGTAGGSGQGLAVVAGTSNVITGVTVTNPGSGYTAAPSITLSNTGTGSGALFAVPGLNNTYGVTAITMTNKGSGYVTAPTITLSGVGSGAGASFTVNLGTTNVITSVTVTNPGAGYKVIPTFTLLPSTGSGATFTLSTTSAPDPGVNVNWAGNGVPTTAADYFTLNSPPGNPAGYIPDAGSALASGADASIMYPNVADGSVTKYPKFKDRSDCVAYSDFCSWSEEQQNYANWRTYHSNRLDMAKTGVGLAFQPLAASFRLGWATINQLQGSTNLQSGVRLYDSPTNKAFLDWLYLTNSNGNTPNRLATDRVGQYFTRKDDDGPWGDKPDFTTAASKSTVATTGTANNKHAACRRNYAILMTDGYYNETFTTNDSDSTLQSNAANQTYAPIGPYSDNVAGTPVPNSFADVAHKYWFQSLRPDLSQTGLKTAGIDEATWPHMNFYAIGLGIGGTLDPANPETLTRLSGGPGTRLLDWPTPTSNNPKAIDDMWHATINGRGALLNAGTAEKLRLAVRNIVAAISGKESSQAGVAVSAVQLTENTRKYVPVFVPGEWTGNVQAYDLDGLSGDQNSTLPAWQVETFAGTDPTTGANTYTSLIPAAGARNIVVGNGSPTKPVAVDFTWSNVNSSTLKAQMTGGPLPVTSNLIDYLRGDASNEATDANALKAAAIYRVRQARLGDIVNSTPVFVKTSVDLKYDNVGVAGYRSFVTSKAARKEGVLFVGANDGILHAFRDGIIDPVTKSVIQPGGIEVFGYVPNALLPSLSKLADKGYTHQYYVDGPLTETDTYFPSAATWANMVLGSTGGGAGKPSSFGIGPRNAVFAINTTSLTSSVTSLNANSVQWEVSPGTAGYDELGYVLSDIQSGPTPDGSWVAIYGNGYESKSCRAQLFITNIETGALIKKIDTGAGSCGGSVNGLGGVRLVRTDKGVVIGAYAGDLLGNMWKFDLSAADPNGWKVGLGGDPLYNAGVGQAITAPPTVVDLSTTPETTTPKPTGYMVVFGTGKFFEAVDKTSVGQQTLYGAWDDQPFGATGVKTGYAKVQKTDMVLQNVVSNTTTKDANGNDITYTATSKNKVDYTSAKGWYFDFPNTGQRLVYPMDLLVNRFVTVDSISPSNVSVDPCVGAGNGLGFFYVIDALSGAAPNTDVLSVTGINGFSTKADGRNVTVETNAKLDSLPTDPKTYCVLSTDPNCTKLSFDPCKIDPANPACNPSVTGLKSRDWRQLFPR